MPFYRAMVWSHWECWVWLWLPFLKKNIGELAKVQKRSTKIKRLEGGEHNRCL